MSIKPQLFEQPYIKPTMKPKGTIRLFLEGSEDGLQRLADLHQSGELQAFLNVKSDDISEIVVAKVEFTTNAKVIEKAELIKAIREGTIDKTTLQQVDLSGADLSEAILSGADLKGAILSGADLSWAILSDANLSRADLNGAILSGADLRGANLSRATLSGAKLNSANLWEADLIEANLIEANLSGANLWEADLREADLSGADVENAIFIDATDITSKQIQDLIRRGAILLREK